MQLESARVPQSAQRAEFEPLAGENSAFKMSYVDDVRTLLRCPCAERFDGVLCTQATARWVACAQLLSIPAS